jgi:hypothetical protein
LPFFRQIEQDGAGFKQAQRATAVGGSVVNDRRDLVVRRDREKLRMKLFPFADIHPNEAIGQLRFFEEERDFVAVGVGA